MAEVNLADNLTIYVPHEVIDALASFSTLLQAIGGIILLYLIFNIITTILNRKKQKNLENISRDLKEIKYLLKEQYKTKKKSVKKRKK